MTLPALSLLQTRVLGVLAEKQRTVPDSYPLSLNALTLGCNQKTARDPVIEASEADVAETIDALKSLHLVFEGSGSRVPRFEHNLAKGLGVPGQSVAILAMLMLRGPQTAAELRLNTDRLHRFADISSVEGFLDELATREPPFVTRLARAPGARESRWAHLLSGPVAHAAPAHDAAMTATTSMTGGVRSGSAAGASAHESALAAHAHAASVDPAELLAWRDEQVRQRGEIDALRAQVQRLAAALGVALDDA